MRLAILALGLYAYQILQQNGLMSWSQPIAWPIYCIQVQKTRIQPIDGNMAMACSHLKILVCMC